MIELNYATPIECGEIMVSKDDGNIYSLNIDTSRTIRRDMDALDGPNGPDGTESRGAEKIGPNNDNADKFESEIDRITQAIEESRTARGAEHCRGALYDTASGGDFARINTGDDNDVPADWRAAERFGAIQSKDVNRIIHSPFFRILSRKTQLFPLSTHSNIRNRLTHSLEVNDIAVRIARRLNATHDYFSDNKAINIDIVRCAALAHDIGHPPFGHAGEAALAELMSERGGFESNAQTLRIVTGLERRMTAQAAGEGQLFNKNTRGLNLTHRAIASMIKYDQPLLKRQDNSGKILSFTGGGPRKVVNAAGKKAKGYYDEEAEIVQKVKAAVLRDPSRKMKTIECSIMDIADDIAYSVYDLEDAMIVGRVHPLEISSMLDGASFEAVHKEVNEEMTRLGYEYDLSKKELKAFLRWIAGKSNIGLARDYDFSDPFDRSRFVEQCYLESRRIAADRTRRRRFCEDRIAEAIASVTVELDSDCPASSVVRLGARCQVETLILKALNYNIVIQSAQIRASETKVKRVFQTVFEALCAGVFDATIPSDIKDSELYDKSVDGKARLACDVICAMTEDDIMAAYQALVSGQDLTATQFHSLI